MTPADPPRPPSDSPGADALLQRWREQVLYRATLIIVAVLATISGSVFAYQHWRQGAVLPVVAVTIVLLAVWAAARGSRISSNARLRVTIVVAYASGLLSLATLGLSAEGSLGLFGFMSLVALLLGAKRAREALYLSAGTVLLCAAGYVFNLLPAVDPALVDARNPWNWLRLLAFASGLVAVVGGAAELLLSELMKGLNDRTQLIHRLREENRERELASARLAETQERLLHAHKLEAVGRLAGGIAHDFNNTLTIILSYSELMKSRLGPGNPLGELADQIIQAAEQGGELTKQLLTFTRRQVVKPRTVDVQQVLRNTERALQRLVPRSIRVHRVDAHDELYVKVDPTQLQQAVLNLALNARDAMPDGGDLYLETHAVTLEAQDGLPGLPGAYVMVRVRDTGTGMSPETQARMFEPFYTTKEPGLGTGLGLSNVRETTESAGGFIDVQTEAGKGSALTLYFPRTEARASGVEATSTLPRPEPATVLVVDDEPQIREVIGTMLKDRGYGVRTADGAKAALAQVKAGHIDLVCTDLVMPDMSGAKLIDELRRSCGKTPIIVCSAYGIDEEVSRLVARGEVLFLSKPFTSQALLDLVNKALSGPRNGRSASA